MAFNSTIFKCYQYQWSQIIEDIVKPLLLVQDINLKACVPCTLIILTHIILPDLAFEICLGTVHIVLPLSQQGRLP